MEIAEHNHDTELKATTDKIYVEIKTGQTHYLDMLIDRSYQPEGGESLDQVSSRAKRSLIALLAQYSKEIDKPPKEFLDKVKIDSPNVLPEGIPHVVVVSHCGFLAEFYDVMYGWNEAGGMSTCDYENTDWYVLVANRALPSESDHGTGTGHDILYGMTRKPNIWNIQICERLAR